MLFFRRTSVFVLLNHTIKIKLSAKVINILTSFNTIKIALSK